jgi:hypothetical protein
VKKIAQFCRNLAENWSLNEQGFLPQEIIDQRFGKSPDKRKPKYIISVNFGRFFNHAVQINGRFFYGNKLRPRRKKLRPSCEVSPDPATRISSRLC